MFMRKPKQSINYHDYVRETTKAKYKLPFHCNYPDTYKSVLREWGFQKEKY